MIYSTTMKNKILTLGLGFMAFVPLYTYAEESPINLTSTSSIVISSTSTITLGTISPKTFTMCSQEAIEVRDTNIASSRTTYNIAMTNALLERKNSEKAAIALKKDDSKKDALKLSVETYKHQTKSAQVTLTQARKLTWQTFDNDIKKCRDLEETEATPTTLDEQPTTVIDPTPFSKKIEKLESKEEVKTIKETLKAQFESFKSLFN